MIELRALGDLRLRDSEDGREILSVLARAKPPGVLVYLALSPTDVSHSREKLLELLWPDSRTKKGRNSLSQALHILRSGLGPRVLGTTEDGELFLEADALWSDVAAFDEALAAGHEREALELYRGHLWDGSDFSDCPAFERWLERERQRLRLKAVGAAVTHAQELERDGSFVDAAKWLQQARDWAPFDEIVVQLLLKLLHRLGDRDAAVREYEAYENGLAEVELRPSVEMSDLIEKIRSPATGSEAAGPEPAVLAVIRAEPTDAASLTEAHRGGSVAPASVTTRPRASWRTRGRAAAAIVVLGAIAAAGATVMRNGRNDEPALDPTRVLVDVLQNETGDPALDPLGRMATDRVTAGLTYNGFVDVVSLGTRLLSLEPVAVDADSREQYGRLQALARANGTGTVVSGSYYLQNDSVHFLARVADAATGEELTTIEPIRGPVDAPLDAIERLRDRVMTTLATLTDPRLARWMRNASKPPTFEAYQAFVKGIELHATDGNPRVAGAQFTRAAALDSTFTMPMLYATMTGGYTGPARDSIHQNLNSAARPTSPPRPRPPGLFVGAGPRGSLGSSRAHQAVSGDRSQLRIPGPSRRNRPATPASSSGDRVPKARRSRELVACSVAVLGPDGTGVPHARRPSPGTRGGPPRSIAADEPRFHHVAGDVCIGCPRADRADRGASSGVSIASPRSPNGRFGGRGSAGMATGALLQRCCTAPSSGLRIDHLSRKEDLVIAGH